MAYKADMDMIDGKAMQAKNAGMATKALNAVNVNHADIACFANKDNFAMIACNAVLDFWSIIASIAKKANCANFANKDQFAMIACNAVLDYHATIASFAKKAGCANSTILAKIAICKPAQASKTEWKTKGENKNADHYNWLQQRRVRQEHDCNQSSCRPCPESD